MKEVFSILSLALILTVLALQMTTRHFLTIGIVATLAGLSFATTYYLYKKYKLAKINIASSLISFSIAILNLGRSYLG
ncbi:MAG: hypothetical protein A3D35_02370 [Candidatus Staskawiczbacteria bacterium RIFCSPHIGHO2_02_FULL_34_9]|uniref:Uncharacterized protein n=1 Tax=Candidatus Staskawiczbacteria bacterium RIFCSPHIGHO2_02_FULL_34_9 TaxID=1802206 RepID=A0A1G2HZH1_9BACT|nr:MAG: hypothetical protein A3D35_02370 [Candidatus Staskawiczbacteria bacterium RIFCSPHIGHO2_02_FULL_34_9]